MSNFLADAPKIASKEPIEASGHIWIYEYMNAPQTDTSLARKSGHLNFPTSKAIKVIIVWLWLLWNFWHSLSP